MSLVQRIKKSYYQKLLEDLVANEKIVDLKNNLLNILQKDQKLFFDIAPKIFSSLLKDEHFKNFYKNNIIWVNGFEDQEIKFINEFLNFYFSKKHKNTINTGNYFNEILEITQSNIDYLNLIDYSYIYQFIISHKYNSDTVVLSNTSAFFSWNKKYFSIPEITKGFIYVTRNPYHIYSKKFSEEGNQTSASSHLLNLEKKPTLVYDFNNIHYVEVLKEGWHTNLASWEDKLVMERYNGFVIEYENIIANPVPSLSSIVIFLKSIGVDIDLDAKIITEFVDNYNFHDDYITKTLSKKELKFLDQYLQPFANNHHYSAH